MSTGIAATDEGKSLQQLHDAADEATGKDKKTPVETDQEVDQTDTGEDKQPDAGEPDEDDPLAVTKFYDEEYGAKDSTRFKDDREWFRHVRELQQKIGERDEDAILGRKLRERLGQEGTDLEALLNAAPVKKDKQQADDLPELKREWFTFDEDGKLRPAMGAPKDLTERYLQRQIALLTEPEKFLDRLVGPKLEEIKRETAATKAEIAQRQEQQELQAACERHRKILYVGGDRSLGMTPLGQQIADDVSELAASGSHAVALLDRMVQRLAPQQTKPNNRAPSQRAVRHPGIAQPTAPSDKELEELLAVPGGLTQVLIERLEREKNAKI